MTTTQRKVDAADTRSKAAVDVPSYDEPPCADPHAARGVGSGGRETAYPIRPHSVQATPSVGQVLALLHPEFRLGNTLFAPNHQYSHPMNSGSQLLQL